MTTLWSGRFAADMTKSVLDFTKTIDIDVRLIDADLRVNLAHVLMLCHQRLVNETDGRAIVGCVLDLMLDADEGRLELRDEYEDVHLNIEQMLIARLGLDVGGQVNLARSRNDQVVTDTRLYLREALICLQRDLVRFIEDLLDAAERHLETPAIGYTHGQVAQPITYGFWLSGYASVFGRDVGRMADAYDRVNSSTLGACALAGTSLPIDREVAAVLLGFPDVVEHALDATSSRDFVVESISALAIVLGHFSRLAEEIVLWSSAEFGLIAIDDAFATGSSIMPQKKNPVIAELVRARAGRVYGGLVQILTTVKGVQMGYSCDLQEDKPPLWQALDVTQSTIAIMRELVGSMQYNGDRARRLLNLNFSTATELANHLARETDTSFREAHRVVGNAVNELIRREKTLADVEVVVEILASRGVVLGESTVRWLVDPVQAIFRQTSEGGTAPSSVHNLLQRCRTRTALARADVENNARDIVRGGKELRAHARRFIDGIPIEQVVAEARARSSDRAPMRGSRAGSQS